MFSRHPHSTSHAECFEALRVEVELWPTDVRARPTCAVGVAWLLVGGLVAAITEEGSYRTLLGCKALSKGLTV